MAPASAYFKVLTTKHGVMESVGARAYNGGLGAEPPAGSRGRAPSQGGKAPWSCQPFSFSTSNDSGKIYPIDCMWQTECFWCVYYTNYIEQDSKYFPPEDWMIRPKAAEGDGPPGDGFQGE